MTNTALYQSVVGAHNLALSPERPRRYATALPTTTTKTHAKYNDRAY